MAAKNEWVDKDYYKDLGVAKDATDAEIKKAYRKLARENHPDSNPGNAAAEERFKAVAEAYDVIGDPQKRQEYDELRSMVSSQGAGFPGGFRTENPFGDIFGGLFNRSGGAGYTARPTRGADVETSVTLSFREAAKGTTIPLKITGDAPCSDCHGSGSKTGATSTCSYCNGTGFTSQQRGAFGFSAPCSHCGGQGKTVSDPCQSCAATGTVRRSRTITVRIPVGVSDGQKVRLAGQGEAGPNGAPSGDLFVHVHVEPDPVFERQGDDLLVPVPVSFAEAALGETIEVPTLDATVKLKVPAGSPHGRVLRVRGKGIPKRGGAAGDLLVRIEVQVPSNLDAQAVTALRTYAQAEKASGFNPRG